MGLGKLVLVSLVLLEVLLVHAMADQVEPKPSEVYKVHNKDEPAESPAEESREAEAPENRRLGKHHPSNKSVGGGGVIIGGIFFIAVFASVFAYIRVTRERVDAKH